MCEHECGACGELDAGHSAAVPGDAVPSAIPGPGLGVPIDRRELLKRGGLAAAALLLAACGAGTADAITGAPSGKVTVNLSQYPTLATSGGVALVRGVAVENSGGSYIALSLRCPHQGGQIVQSGSGFQCLVHGARFNATGTWIGGQRTSSMYRLSVTDNGDGTLTIG